MNDSGMQIIGATFALLSALLWAGASMYWSILGRTLPPLLLNLGKGIIALIGIGLLLAVQNPANSIDIPWQSLFMLSLSGIFGIAIGDTTFFISLNILGPRRSLLISSLIPVVTTFLAFLVLDEHLALGGYFGAILCIGGVYSVMRQRSEITERTRMESRGIILGFCSVLACSLSVIFAKIAVLELPALEATGIRLFSGTAGLAFFIFIRFRSISYFAPLASFRTVVVLVPVAIVSTLLGIWLSMAALQYTTASVASILSATSPIFILPLAALFLKEKISPSALIGAIVTVGGIAFLLINQ